MSSSDDITLGQGALNAKPSNNRSKADKMILGVLAAVEIIGIGLLLTGHISEGSAIVGGNTALLVAQIQRMFGKHGDDRPLEPGSGTAARVARAALSASGRDHDRDTGAYPRVGPRGVSAMLRQWDPLRPPWLSRRKLDP